MRVLVLAVLLLLAGCVKPAATADPVSAASATTTPTNGTRPPMTLKLDVSSDASGPMGDVNAKEGKIEVPAGYTRLHAEAKWSCATPDPACGFGIYLAQDGQVEKAQRDAAAPFDSRVRAGTYAIGLQSTGPGAQMKGTQP